MKALLDIAREILHLFVDDGFLAVAVLCVVAICAAITAELPGGRGAVGGFLLVGCLAAMIASVLMAQRR